MSVGFPGMGGMPGAVPGAPAVGAGFVLTIPPDPAWEPFETTDTLETDGYYMFRIVKEGSRTDASKSAGVFLTLEILDQDTRGKTLSKFLPDPRTTKGNTWFLWRGVIRSITGDLGSARAGFQYTPGTFTGQTVYARTEAYADNSGDTRTGVDAFVTKAEYEEAGRAGGTKFRWPAKVARGGGAAPVGALPGGLPASFPGMGGPGLPGLPTSGGGAPLPSSAAPMAQPAPNPFTVATTPGAPPQPVSAFTGQNSPAQPAGFPLQTPPAGQLPQTQAGPFQFPAQPGGAPPPGFPPALGAAPTNGAPQPVAFPGFPGLPGAPTT